MTCPRCHAPVAEGTNFCTRCGHDLRGGAPPPAAAGGGARAADDAPSSTLPPASAARTPSPATSPDVPVTDPPLGVAPVDVQLVACPTCGATNAASRERCGRCHAELAGGRAPLAVRDPGVADAHWGPEPDRESRVPRALVVVTVLATIAVGAVVVALLGARGIGWFAPSEAMSPISAEGDQLMVGAVDASSHLGGKASTFGPPMNAVDGDPETAWVEGITGGGTGEWLELVLAEPALVSRVIVWNGNQRGELFPVSNRVGAVRIDIGDRTFTGDLLDRRGPQAIDLPEPVRGERVRLTIEQVVQGERGIDTAISEVELYGELASPTADTASSDGDAG